MKGFRHTLTVDSIRTVAEIQVPKCVVAVDHVSFFENTGLFFGGVVLVGVVNPLHLVLFDSVASKGGVATIIGSGVTGSVDTHSMTSVVGWTCTEIISTLCVTYHEHVRYKEIYDLLLTTETKIKVLERVVDLGTGKTTENNG